MKKHETKSKTNRRGQRKPASLVALAALIVALTVVLAGCPNPAGGGSNNGGGGGGNDGPGDGGGPGGGDPGGDPGGGDGGGTAPVWREIDTLFADAPGSFDAMGTAVAVSGDTAIVGAPNRDGPARDTGAAYILVRTTDGQWNLQQMITPATDAALDDFFGTSVAIDGDTAVVGAPGKDDGASLNAGAAYVFVRGAGGQWTEQEKLTAGMSAQAGAEFGSAVAVHGTAAIVGAHREDLGAFTDAGAAYVFERDGTGQWGDPQRLIGDTNLSNGGDRFGVSVSITAGTAIIGAPGVDEPGPSGAANVGAMYLSIRGATDWSPTVKYTASDGTAGDRFGSSVAISGQTAIVGAVAGDASFDVADSGAAYVFGFNPDTGTYVEEEKLIASDAAFLDAFGAGVAISGNTAIVGAPDNDLNSSDEGAAYIFTSDGAGGWSETASLLASGGAGEDQLGTSVAISGITAVIGAPGLDQGANNAGGAYLFRFE